MAIEGIDLQDTVLFIGRRKRQNITTRGPNDNIGNANIPRPDAETWVLVSSIRWGVEGFCWIFCPVILLLPLKWRSTGQGMSDRQSARQWRLGDGSFWLVQVQEARTRETTRLHICVNQSNLFLSMVFFLLSPFESNAASFHGEVPIVPSKFGNFLEQPPAANSTDSRQIHHTWLKLEALKSRRNDETNLYVIRPGVGVARVAADISRMFDHLKLQAIKPV